jgi:putative membrane protein
VKPITALFAAFIASAAVHAHAEDPAPVPAASTMDNAMGDVSIEHFVPMATSSNLLEIQSSELALQKGSSDQVKQFAQQMITDHTKAGLEMKAALSQREGDLGSPDTLLKEDAAALDRLKNADAGSFDQAYIDLQRMAHDKAVALFQSYASKPDDPTLGAFAQKTLPVLEMHRQHVMQLAGK